MAFKLRRTEETGFRLQEEERDSIAEMFLKEAGKIPVRVGASLIDVGRHIAQGDEFEPLKSFNVPVLGGVSTFQRQAIDDLRSGRPFWETQLDVGGRAILDVATLGAYGSLFAKSPLSQLVKEHTRNAKLVPADIVTKNGGITSLLEQTKQNIILAAKKAGLNTKALEKISVAGLQSVDELAGVMFQQASRGPQAIFATGGEFLGSKRQQLIAAYEGIPGITGATIRAIPEVAGSEISRFLREQQERRERETLQERAVTELAIIPLKVVKGITADLPLMMIGGLSEAGKTLQELIATPIVGSERAQELARGSEEQRALETRLFGFTPTTFADYIESIDTFLESTPVATETEKKLLPVLIPVILFSLELSPYGRSRKPLEKAFIPIIKAAAKKNVDEVFSALGPIIKADDRTKRAIAERLIGLSEKEIIAVLKAGTPPLPSGAVRSVDDIVEVSIRNESVRSVDETAESFIATFNRRIADEPVVISFNKRTLDDLGIATKDDLFNLLKRADERLPGVPKRTLDGITPRKLLPDDRVRQVDRKLSLRQNLIQQYRRAIGQEQPRPLDTKQQNKQRAIEIAKRTGQPVERISSPQRMQQPESIVKGEIALDNQNPIKQATLFPGEYPRGTFDEPDLLTTRKFKQTEEWKDFARYAEENLQGKDIRNPVFLSRNATLTMERVAEFLDGGINGKTYRTMVKPVYDAAEAIKREGNQTRKEFKQFKILEGSTLDRDASLYAQGKLDTFEQRSLETLQTTRDDLMVIDTGKKFEGKPVKEVTTDSLLGEDVAGVGAEDATRIDEWEQVLKEGKDIEPLKVVVGEDTIFTEDGKHRLAAARRVGLETIEVIDVTPPKRIKAKVPQKVKDVAEYTRNKYDEYLVRLNEKRALLGVEPIPKRADYITHLNELNALSEFFGGIERLSTKDRIKKLKNELLDKHPDWNPERAFQAAKRKVEGLTGITQYVDARHPKFPHTKQRVADFEKNPSIVRSFNAYMPNALRYIYQAENVAKNKAFKDVLPANASEFARLWNTEQVAGRVPPSFLSPIGKRVVSAIRGTLGANTILGNMATTMMQLTSFPQVFAMAGPINTFMGIFTQLQTVLPGHKSLYDLSRTKALRNLDIDMGLGDSLIDQMLVEVGRLERLKNPAARARQGINFGRLLLRGLMEGTDGFTTGATYHAFHRKGLQEGYDPALAKEYADIMAGKTQANYWQEAIPPFLNTLEGKAVGQFGTYGMNQWEMFKRDLGKTFVPGAPSERRTKEMFKQFMVFLTAAYIIDSLSEETFGRQPYDIKALIDEGVDYVQGEGTLGEVVVQARDTIATYLPFLSSVKFQSMPPVFEFGSDVLNATWGSGRAQAEAIDNLEEKWVYNILLPYGGNQVRKSLQGVEKVFDIDLPFVRNVSKNFDVETNIDVAKAIIFSPYATSEALDYFEERDKPKKKKGFGIDTGGFKLQGTNGFKLDSGGGFKLKGGGFKLE